MTRLCAQCGYDISKAPVGPGGRRCPECGLTGKGRRPWRGFRRALWRATAPGLVLWACALVAVVAEKNGLGLLPGVAPAGALVVSPLLITAAGLASIIEPFRISRTIGRRACLAGRLRWQARLLTAGWGIQLGAAGLTLSWLMSVP